MKKYFIKLLPEIGLVVCSREIQIGDKVQCEEPEYKEWICSQNDLDNCPLTIFKVIGKVSPEAIWIKPGDELANNEVESIGGYILYWNENLTHWNKNKDYYYSFLKIRNIKCNHFH